MEIVIQESTDTASTRAAKLIARLVNEKPDAVIGLATGSTPLKLYKELIRIHDAGELDFSQVTTFNLDEYIGLPKDHPQSYHTFMWDNFFSHINIAPENAHLPDGLAADVPTCCAAYEAAIVAAGGIDLQVLGIGSNGHIGFNEPTSSFASRTRIKTLAQHTVKDNARFFDGDESRVPHHCLTMGIGTIMDARCVLLLAFGESKAVAIADAVEGPVASMAPASILQHHANAKFFLDDDAASRLSMADYYRWVYDGKPEWQQNA